MSRGLNVFVSIGAKVGSSLNASARLAERRFEQMGRRLRIIGAQARASLAGMEQTATRINEVGRGGRWETARPRPTVGVRADQSEVGPAKISRFVRIRNSA
jgi:hypothetical protein